MGGEDIRPPRTNYLLMSDDHRGTLRRVISRSDQYIRSSIDRVYNRIDSFFPAGLLDLVVAAVAFIAPAVKIVPAVGYTGWALATVGTFLGTFLVLFGGVSVSPGRIGRVQDAVPDAARVTVLIVGVIMVVLVGWWLIPAIGIKYWVYMVILVVFGHLPLLSGTYAFSKAYLN